MINTVDMELFTDKQGLLPHNSRVIVALSGGADSVFLLHALHQLQKKQDITLIAAHLNHEWRTQADDDAQFCHNLAQSLEIPFVCKKISELGMTPSNIDSSREAQGRAARRFFLQQILTMQNADCIALAHHAQDQLETFLIRLARGTSLSGLIGMRPKAGIYIRPLLSMSPQIIRSELARAGIAFVEDISNTSPLFLRNRIRHTVVPGLQACDDRFENNFTQSLRRLTQTEEFLIEYTTTLFAQMCHEDQGKTWIDLIILRLQHPIMQQRLMVHWLCMQQVSFPSTESFLQELLRFLLSTRGGMHKLHHEWRVHKKKSKASIQKY